MVLPKPSWAVSVTVKELPAVVLAGADTANTLAGPALTVTDSPVPLLIGVVSVTTMLAVSAL
jgi:hypothetical protein